MADTFNKNKRSEIIKCVHSNENKLNELRLSLKYKINGK